MGLAWNTFDGVMACGLYALGAVACTGAGAADPAPWQVVGRQGLVQVVIVPDGQRSDVAAYRAQIARLCPPERTCFVNFHTNSSGAVLELPLPDAIAAEPTARFRRSAKNGAEILQWSCRLGMQEGECF
jgi:hypothetical protein